MNRRCESSGAHSISVILVTPGIGIVDTANPAGTTAEWSLKAIPNTPKRLSILPGIIILTVLKQNLQTGATSVGLTAANRWDEAGVVEDGRFNIAQARPGRYALHAFADGVLGEFARTDLVVAPSRPAISRPASSMTTSASNWMDGYNYVSSLPQFDHVFLFVSKRHHRIGPCRSPRRQPAGEQSHSGQRHCDA